MADDVETPAPRKAKCRACEWIARGGATSLSCTCGPTVECALPSCPWWKDRPEPVDVAIPESWKAAPLRLTLEPGP